MAVGLFSKGVRLDICELLEICVAVGRFTGACIGHDCCFVLGISFCSFAPVDWAYSVGPTSPQHKVWFSATPQTNIKLEGECSVFSF